MRRPGSVHETAVWHTDAEPGSLDSEPGREIVTETETETELPDSEPGREIVTETETETETESESETEPETEAETETETETGNDTAESGELLARWRAAALTREGDRDAIEDATMRASRDRAETLVLEHAIAAWIEASARGVFFVDAEGREEPRNARARELGRSAGARNLDAVVALDGQYLVERTPPPSIAAFVRRAHATERQAAVLRGLVDGLSNKEIAARLEVAESAVERELGELFRRVGVSGRVELLLRGVLDDA
jgi:DNA-binding NarL/FixJ family response regulator